MDNHYKIRKAIIVAIALMGTGYSWHTKAMGLGDISVESYIGQPLLASVLVNGLPKKADAQCFNVVSEDANAVHDVQHGFKRLDHDSGILTITSRHAVNEPIASISVTSLCESSFTRHYNLLLDPAPLVATSEIDTARSGFTTPEIEGSQETVRVTSKSASTVMDKPRNNRAKKAANTTKSPAPGISTDKTSNSGQTIKSATSVAPSVKVSKPLLTISGGAGITVPLETTSLKLNFDRSIKTDRATHPAAYAEEAAFADEITVMNNRLSHLDKQLSSLKMQNIALQNNNASIAAEVVKVKHENDMLRVLAMFLGGGLLASSFFFVDWLRRRNAALREAKEKALWESLQSEFEANEPVVAPLFSSEPSTAQPQSPINAAEQEKNTSEPTLDEIDHGFVHSIYSNSEDHIIEEATNVLDDAKLFISHGRVELAIQLLQSHLIDYPRESAENWQMLLELLAQEDKRDAFDIAAREYHKYFNVETPVFPDDENLVSEENMEISGGVEASERISQQLQKVWGTPQCTQYLDELIHNTRNQPREGFDQELFDELVLLRNIAEEEIRLAEVIPLESKLSVSNKEKSMALNLPNIQVSEEFKDITKTSLELEPLAASVSKPQEEYFEFELLDIAHR